jgi:hypothetical protein
MKHIGWFLPFAILHAVGCERVKPLATGEDDEIIVFADDATWHALETTLRMVFEDTVYTPQPERWFNLRRMPVEQFNNYETHKNRIIIAPTDGEGPVAEYVRSALSPEVKTMVDEGKEFVIVKYDTRARGQLLMFLTAPSLPALDASMRARAVDLLYYFRNMSLKRELAGLEAARRYHKVDIEQRLLKQYGWTMYVQHDYLVAIDSAEARFFWMRRATPTDMERWIFVHWIPTDDPSILTDRFVLALRDSLTRRFLRTIDDAAHVEIAPYYLEIQQTDFLGRFAYEVRGNWRFSDRSGGGPFVSYAFYDTVTQRIYLIDGSIFAPRVEKKKLILQVDGILHTFRTEPQAIAQQ